MSDLYVARLVQYGLESGLIPEEERIYSTNQILEVMKKDDYEAPPSSNTPLSKASSSRWFKVSARSISVPTSSAVGAS